MIFVYFVLIIDLRGCFNPKETGGGQDNNENYPKNIHNISRIISRHGFK